MCITGRRVVDFLIFFTDVKQNNKNSATVNFRHIAEEEVCEKNGSIPIGVVTTPLVV